jgi:hypothetical protein
MDCIFIKSQEQEEAQRNELQIGQHVEQQQEAQYVDPAQYTGIYSGSDLVG